ncbi:MAG TPA: universal stress protein [Streptosporangiaceae bacterium]|jgi:nucleotide-binding universal stress UspA family protein
MATKPVIAGTDGSQESLLAVEWAAREAVLHGASLRIVAIPVLPPRMSPSPATRDTVASMVEHSMTRALAAAAQRAAALEPDLAIQTQLLAGSPHEVLAGAGPDASMLVLGSRGAGGFSAMILGSVSRYVATHAAVPVVVAREETMAAHREVVVGLRDPARPGPALGFAFEEAALRKARLLAVHAWSWSAPGHTRAPEEETSHLERAVTSWREKFPDVEVHSEVVHAHPGRVLSGLSARADLVVLGRHEPGGPQDAPGVGSVTHAVLSHAHGPVVSVPGD